MKTIMNRAFSTLLLAALLATPALGAEPAPAPAAAPAADAAAGDGIAWLSFEESLEKSGQNGRMTLLVFSTSWCGWCKKMKAGALADARVHKLAREFNCGQVDGDLHPGVLALMGIKGFPTVVILDPQGNEVFRGNYLDTDAFIRALADHRTPEAAAKAARAPGEEAKLAAAALKGANAEAVDAAASRAVELLARSTTLESRLLRTALTDAGETAWPALARELSSPELGRRAAAAALLIEQTGANLAFDPFAEEAARKEQAQAWAKWVAQQKDQPAKEEKAK